MSNVVAILNHISNENPLKLMRYDRLARATATDWLND